jgi:hypothetical protein
LHVGIHRAGGKRIQAWFDTKLLAEAEATQRNFAIQLFGQKAATFSGALAYMAMECQSCLQEYGKSLHDATAHYLRHLESVKRSVPLTKRPPQYAASLNVDWQPGRSANAISNRC